ncbi:hypothetical protein FF2_037419 [Malus domestica]
MNNLEILMKYQKFSKSKLRVSINLPDKRFPHRSLAGSITPLLDTHWGYPDSSQLDSSQLTGDIPIHLISLQNNGLTGSIPTTFGNLVNLVTLGLASCSFNGPIPPRLGLLENLILQFNQLEGLIPTELGNCSSLTIFTAAKDTLNRTIPTELTDMLLHNNSLFGSISSLDGRVPLVASWSPTHAGDTGNGAEDCLCSFISIYKWIYNHCSPML